MYEKVKAVCSSIIGTVRKHNEDNFYFNNSERIEEEELNLKQEIKDQDVICIFDGMGGETKGDVASLTAATTLKRYINDNNTFDFSEYIEIANNRVLKKSKKSEIVGTTIVGIYFNKDKIQICNVGDSKILGLKNNKLVQLSIDDNEEETNKKLGINSKGALTQHLGLKDDEMVLEPHIKEYDIKDFNKIILCSDGLTDMLSLKDIEEVINNNSIEEALPILIDKVLDKGAKDNTTIIIINLYEEEIPIVEEIEVKKSIFDIFRKGGKE